MKPCESVAMAALRSCIEETIFSSETPECAISRRTREALAAAKARAVAAWGFPTARMAEAAQNTPGFGDAPHVVTVGGGVPVYSADGRERLGGVGVSGEAPADDAACAEAGIAAAGLSARRAG